MPVPRRSEQATPGEKTFSGFYVAADRATPCVVLPRRLLDFQHSINPQVGKSLDSTPGVMLEYRILAEYICVDLRILFDDREVRDYDNNTAITVRFESCALEGKGHRRKRLPSSRGSGKREQALRISCSGEAVFQNLTACRYYDFRTDWQRT